MAGEDAETGAGGRGGGAGGRGGEQGVPPVCKGFRDVAERREDDDRQFSFQVSTDGGSSYGIAGTSTVFQAYHYEDNSATSLSYQASVDRANSTSYMNIGISMNNPADSSLDGELYLFAPSSTTYVKHWYATTQLMAGATGVVGPWSVNNFTAGYFNTTSAVDAIDFEFSSSSQMDNAVIKMYGL